MGIGKEKKRGHYSVLRLIGSSIFTIVLCALPAAVFAAWGSPAEIISGSWGSGNDEFGIRYEDTADMFPRFTITSEGKIVVRDGINRRLKVYTSTGGLEAIIPYRAGRKYTELTLADSYGFSGDFVGFAEGGANYFYRADQKVYINFSPTGQIIKTSTTRPAELGVVSEQSVGTGQYKITVKFPDKEWSIIGKGAVPKYTRDVNGNLYGSGDRQAIRYSYCGKELARLTIPKANIQEISRGEQLDPKINVLEEYGSPVIAPNGDVYTWKRTPDKYSILKWTWVDDPNVPTGPDAPTELKVMPSTTGLYLTWTASPNDPGCVTGYEISRATTAGGVGSTITTVNAGTVKYNDTTASAGTTYYYKVRAVAGSEYSPYTSEVSGKR